MAPASNSTGEYCAIMCRARSNESQGSPPKWTRCSAITLPSTKSASRIRDGTALVSSDPALVNHGCRCEHRISRSDESATFSNNSA